MRQHGTIRETRQIRRRFARFWLLLWLLALTGSPWSAAQSNNPAALNVPWTLLAPQSLTTQATGPAGGRILSVAVDPSDTTGNTVYLGTSGGVWKSTNAAAASSASVSFVPVTDRVPAVDTANSRINVLSVGAVSVQPGHTGVVLAGTGDPTSLPDSIYGTGILRSADGGNSWSEIGGSRDPGTGLEQNSFFGEAVSGFAWGTASPNFVVAALSSATGAYAVNAGYLAYSASGLYYSQDAGQTWLMATIQDGPNQVLEAPGRVGAGVAALAVVWNPIRHIFVAAIRYHGFYSSPDGINWTRLAAQPGTALTKTACPPSFGGSGSTNCPIYAAGLAVQPGSGDMFAMATSQSDSDSGLWQDVCAPSGGNCTTPVPTFSTQIGNAALETSTGTIAGASHALWLEAIASGNDTLLFAGTQDLFRCSLAAGCVWRNATHVNSCAAALVGPMQHSVAWVPGSTTLYVANDRGLWRSRDAMNQQQAACSADDASHFDNLNTSLGSLAEVTALAQDPTDAGQLVTGTGALGTSGGNNGAWQSLLSGPGAYAAAGKGVTAGTWFATSGAGVAISACSLGTQCGPGDFGNGVGPAPVIGNAQVGGDGAALASPAVWTIDPADNSKMLVATCRVWRGAADGTNWGAANALSGTLDNHPTSACQGNTQIRSLAATGALSGGGSTLSERIYAGLAGYPDGAANHGGHVLTALVTASSTAASTTWHDLTGNPVTNDATDSHVFDPGGIGISGIAVDPTDASGSTFYVSLSGFGGSGFAETTNAPLLYGSTDAGQHWANLTNNLPNAPVNAVLVDPEDPAIVYAATDVGVFVTTSITQCANPRQNCWSTYGTGLPAVRVTTLTAVDSSGEKWLRIGTKGRGVWQAELASTAIQSAAATATLTPSSLTFAGQAVGTVSASQTFTIHNTGSVALQLGAASVDNSDFAINDQCQASVAVGGSCTISVIFAPTVMGTRTGTLTVAANVQSGVLTASMQGIGDQGGVIVLTPLRLDFGSERIGQTSAPQYLTVANTGTAVASLSSFTINGPFAITANSCGSTLAVNTSCTVRLVFTPTASGVAQGALVVSENSATQTALLSGVGQSAPTDTLNTQSLTFAPQMLGTTSAAQQVSVTNNGDSALTGIAVQITGDFAVDNLCGASLPAHSTCALQVVFSPKAVGVETGRLTIRDILQQQVVTLNGTGTTPVGGSGTAATLSPSTLNFGIQGVNSISSQQTVTVINTGSTALSGISIAASQSFAIANNGCTVTVAPGASCTLGVTFAPQAPGAVSGTVQVTAGGLAAPAQVPVTGTGADFTLSVQGSASSTVTGGSTATYQLILTPVGASAGPVTFTCTGAPAGSTCTTNPASVTMTGTGATSTIQVTVVTAVETARQRPELPPWNRRVLGGATLVCMLPLLGRRKRWSRLLQQPCCVLLALGALCLGLSGCGLSVNGGLGTSPGSGSSGQGVSTITVSGNAPGLSHDVTLTLTVE